MLFVPPVQLPVIFIVPVELFIAAFAFEATPGVDDPPVQLPVIFIVPVELLLTACRVKELLKPPVQFPVIFKVPDPKFATERFVFAAAELVMFPTIVAVAGELAENSKQLVAPVAVLAVTFAVRVTPALMTNFPVPALEISSHVAFAVIVTV